MTEHADVVQEARAPYRSCARGEVKRTVVWSYAAGRLPRHHPLHRASQPGRGRAAGRYDLPGRDKLARHGDGTFRPVSGIYEKLVPVCRTSSLMNWRTGQAAAGLPSCTLSMARATGLRKAGCSDPPLTQAAEQPQTVCLCRHVRPRLVGASAEHNDSTPRCGGHPQVKPEV